MMYIKLFLFSLIPVALSVMFYLLKRTTKFHKKFDGWKEQLIIGVVFGLAAICGTEFGVDVGGAAANVRDAAPLCAGLLFGGPAGIIAGLIGGIERYIAVLWGAGKYSQIACSVSTAFAGIFAALLRKYVFRGRRPSILFGLATGVVMEAIHLTVLFLTHINAPEDAIRIVEIVTGPMVIANAFAVGLSSFIVDMMSRQIHKDRPRKFTIAYNFQFNLLLLIFVAYIVTTGFVYIIQTGIVEYQTDDLLALNLEDISKEVRDTSDTNLLYVTRQIANEIDNIGEPDTATLIQWAKLYEVTEINIVNTSGRIKKSTNTEFVHYNMASEDQSAVFNKLLFGLLDEYVQSYGPIGYDSEVYRKYAGVSLKSGEYVQVGLDADDFQSTLYDQMNIIVASRHLNETGYMILADEYDNVLSELNGSKNNTLTSIGVSLDGKSAGTMYKGEVNGAKAFYMYTETESFIILAVVPQAEAYFTRNAMIYINSFMEIIVLSALFNLISSLIYYVVVRKMNRINGKLEEITSGNLDVRIRERESIEFEVLSESINATVGSLKQYITEAEERIDAELAFAKNVQFSALPSVFPPYPQIPYFNIYATMATAKEVGGDFYDFYLLGENKLAFLIADVSGKGIPAAMFMMRAKTTIKNLAQTGIAVNEILTKANEGLCEGNDANMFVTCWLGILDFNTGHVTYANGGHNPPLIYKKGEGWSYLKGKPGFVLAGMEGYHYKLQEFTLEKGDKIYLYTDGITEATDFNKELYGEERLINFLNENQDLNVNDTLIKVKENVDLFVGDAPQFDDMTMLTIKYNGANMIEKEFDATDEELNPCLDFLAENFEAHDISMKLSMSLQVACEEIFVNVAHYAYGNNVGKCIVGVDINEERIIIRFKDKGIPFNPLQKIDPDITLSAEDRQIGGLGIYMVKQMLDDVRYEYTDGENVLTLMKELK